MKPCTCCKMITAEAHQTICSYCTGYETRREYIIEIVKGFDKKKTLSREDEVFLQNLSNEDGMVVVDYCDNRSRLRDPLAYYGYPEISYEGRK